MAVIRFVSNDKRNCKCSNGCLIRSFSGERFYQVYDGNKPRRGERYCQHCLRYAKMNNPDAVMEDEVAEDTSEESREDGLVTVPGDNRLFARTRYGLRAGYEHTGHRCEDAPCCGCCD
jgi:hypothetical protein